MKINKSNYQNADCICYVFMFLKSCLNFSIQLKYLIMVRLCYILQQLSFYLVDLCKAGRSQSTIPPVKDRMFPLTGKDK